MKIYKILPVILLACALVGCAGLQNLLQPKSPTRTLDKSIEEMYKKVFENFKMPDFGDSNSATEEPHSSNEKRP